MFEKHLKKIKIELKFLNTKQVNVKDYIPISSSITINVRRYIQWNTSTDTHMPLISQMQSNL